MAPLKNASSSKSKEFAIDMPNIDQLEEQRSALKSQEGGNIDFGLVTQLANGQIQLLKELISAINGQKDKLRPNPCKELNPILEEAAAQPGTSLGTKARSLIQKVPRILREIEKNKINYDPRLVSLGPYHYGDPKLELGQTLKTRLVQQFASYVKESSKGSKSLNEYLHSEYFNKVACEARDCYAKESTALNEEAFKCLMFLDGCFVVYFIHCIVNKLLDVHMKIDHQTIIIMDLFLLENQLPYIVLQALVTEFILPALDNKDGDVIENFINMQTAAKGSLGRKPPLYQTVLELFKGKEQQTNNTGNLKAVEREPHHLLDFLRTKFLDTRSSPSNNNVQAPQGDEWQSFRSVDELKAAGIKCVTNGSSCIKNIKFVPYGHIMYARLSLPAIIIDDSFKTKWLNLAAYEACLDFQNDGAITSFICFLDSLIDNTEDVKELRLRGILQNFLGSDQQVAEVFNELATDLTPNPNEYQQVKSAIQNHFNNNWGIWITELLHTHFSSPWTLVAFLGALLALILTSIQTYYAIHPPPEKE